MTSHTSWIAGQLLDVARQLQSAHSRAVASSVDVYERDNAEYVARHMAAEIALSARYIEQMATSLQDQDAELARLREMVRAIPNWTKHGPGGKGGPGDCSPGCLKCRAMKEST